MPLERIVTVCIPAGLHARPASTLVKLAKSFHSDLEILRQDKKANAKSSVRLMLLGVQEGDEIIIRADGDDAEAAVDALARFCATVEEGAPPPPDIAPGVAAPTTGRSGVPASEGVALGRVFAFFPETLRPERRRLMPAEIAGEQTRLRMALDATTARLRAERDQIDRDAQDRDIIDALTEVAGDVELLEAVQQQIAGGSDAASAVIDAGRALAERFEAMPDPYLRARAEDVRGAVRHIALTLLGRKDVSLADIPPGSILVAEEVSAWDFAKAPIASIAGIVCVRGAATSHLAIMARTHGIPAVLGFDGDPVALRTARRGAIDGGTGEVVLDPDAATEAAYRERIAAHAASRAVLDAYATVEPRTRDGALIEVVANLGSLSEIPAARKAGAMGVGLFRTELLFMERKTLPSEETQAAIYTELAQAFAPRPVIIRTLDIGGDKPVAGIDFPAERNPFLGWRGLRMCLDRPDVFKPQLRALLRAATVGNVKVMLPMVTHEGEVRRARALIDACRAELAAEGTAHADFALGIMIETPAAVFMAEELAAVSAFFSIGTNDLTQYVMAADRLNPRLAEFNRAEQPAVLRAMEQVCRAAKQAGIPVGICGEAAARVALIPRFLRIGVTELSMSPSSIAAAKKCVTETTLGEG